jgi:transcriptional regulator with AAA-type ATPase domain
MVALRQRIEQFLRGRPPASRLPTVLIQGETGTGKGLLARCLHRAGPRATGPFVGVACPTIPGALLESEMFGYERGAFTGARQAKPGLFQTAHRGTMFLDEVSLLPEPLQAKLLNVLEDRTVRRLGATRDEPLDVWIVAATNEELATAAHEGRFREDLYHRLAVVTFTLPPLRDRDDDPIRLAEHFLVRACADYGLTPKTFTPGARRAIGAYDWPGNVRELANVIERAVLLAERPVVSEEMLDLPREPGGADPGRTVAAGSLDDSIRGRLQDVLAATGWNVARTATRLGVSRNTVYARIEKYGLRPDREGSPSRQRGAPAPPRAPGRDTPRAADHPTPLRWEPRHVTFMRVRTSDPDGRSWSSARTLEMVRDMARGLGGRVLGVSPTGIFAAFGVEASDEAAVLAGHAALAIQKAAERARREGVSAEQLGISIHSAPCLVGVSGDSRELDAATMRSVWNTLEVLLDAASPGTIVVSAAAAGFLRRRFELTDLGEGRPVFRLVGLAPCGSRGELGPLPFLGRRREVEALRRGLEAASAGGARVVGLAGEPGVGKSRLIREVGAAASAQGWLVLDTAAMPYGRATPFLPVTQLLKHYFGVMDRDDPGTIGEKVAAGLRDLDLPLEPALDAVLGLLDLPPESRGLRELDPTKRKRRELETVRRILRRQSELQPLILVIEDLHWIDSATEVLLDDVVTALADARLLVLVSYRPEHRTAWHGQPWFTELRISPLPADSVAELLRVLVGDDPGLELMSRRVAELAGGNPLFLQECVRTLVETGALTGDRGAFRPGRDLGRIEVPPTVQAILAARIERLAHQDRRLLETAAVIGTTIPLAVLEELEPGGDVRPALERLHEAEFLDESPGRTEPEYAFRHPVTHETVYQSTPPDWRRALHARMVTVMELQYPDRLGEQLERLAHHAVRAELWAKAVGYLRQAGLKAATRSAHREAVSWFQRALDALTHRPVSEQTGSDAIDLRLELRNSLYPLG